MTLSPEIYKTATLLIREYGDLAPAGAFIKADQLRDLGDTAGHGLWLSIAHAVEEILSTERPATSAIH